MALLIQLKHSQKIFLVFCFVLFSSSKFEIRTPWRNDQICS